MLQASSLTLQAAESNLREADEVMGVCKDMTAWLKGIEQQLEKEDDEPQN